MENIIPEQYKKTDAGASANRILTMPGDREIPNPLSPYFMMTLICQEQD